MAERDTSQKRELFLERAKHFNWAFIGAITLLLVASLATYKFFAMPVSAKLILYVYGLQLFSAAVAFLVSYLVRKKMLPVDTKDPQWSYTAVRRYFWSYVLLCVPFAIAFLFFLFAGNLSALLLGYLLSLCGLIVFRPRRGDVV